MKSNFPKGSVKKFREYLNNLPQNQPFKHSNTRGQRTQKYGDYLYRADREMFMVELARWIA